MAIKTYNDQNFVAIANAIRAKNGETTQYKPSEMAPAIMAIESGLELLPQDTVAGAIANFPDGSNNYPVVELIADINPKQEGSGDPAPDNVRPISGYTGMNITKQGKNLFSYDLPLYNGYWIPAFSGNGQETTYENANGWCFYKIPVKEGTTLTFSGMQGVGGVYCAFFKDTPDNVISTFLNGSINGTRTVPTGANFLGVEINRGGTPKLDPKTDFPNAQLEVGSTATAYEAYSAPEVKTISWESEAGTVYGGSLNVTSGLLVKDRAYHKITSADTMYLYNSANGFLVNTSSFAEGEMIALSNSGGLCNAFATVTASTNMGVRFGMSNNSSIYFVQVHDLMGSTLQDIKDYMDEHDIYVVYRLATPETYQLDPEQVKTLLGVNNIYADTGDVEVTYRADIDLYIAKKIAEGA